MTSHHTVPDFPTVAHAALLALVFEPEPAIAFRLVQPRRYAVLQAVRAMPEPANMAGRDSAHVAMTIRLPAAPLRSQKRKCCQIQRQ